MAGSDDGELLDLIYQTAVEPGLWIPVMERFTDMIGGSIAWLSQLSVVDGAGGDLEDPMIRVDPVFPPRYLAYYGQLNPLQAVKDPAAYLRGWTPRILTDEDWMAKEDLVRTEFYNDFQKPQDVHSVMMIRLALQGEETATLNVHRPERWGQFGAAELETAAAYHPHLIRAFGLGRKFSNVRRLQGELAGVLDQSSHGVFLLDEIGRLKHVNRLGQALLREPHGLAVVNGRLSADSAAATRQLQALVLQAASPDPDRRRGGSMALPTPTRRAPLSLTVAPVRGERLAAVSQGHSVMVCATDLEAGVRLPEHRLRDLFGLTPAETRLALALFEGLSPKQAASQFEVSSHTVHVQLARIFEKTGTNRQSDLVRLLMRSAGIALA